MNLNLIYSIQIEYVRWENQLGKGLHPGYSKATIKHGGCNVIACSSASGFVPFVEIQTKSAQGNLATHILQYAECKMPLWRLFQHDNDPKHSLKFLRLVIS